MSSELGCALVDEFALTGDVLESRLRALDWQVAVGRVGGTFLYGSGT